MSTIQSVSGVRSRELQFKQLTDDQVNARIKLFSGDQLETRPSIDTGKEVIALPTFDAREKADLVNLFKNATPEQRVALAEVGNQVVQGLTSSSGGLQAGGLTSPGLQSTLDYAFQTYMMTHAEADANTAVQGVVTTAITASEQDTRDFAEKLAGNLDAKKELRVQIQDIQEQLSDADWSKADKDGKLPFDVVDENGKEKTVMMTKGEAESYKDGLQSKYDTAGDMTQMMQLQLQDAMNKQAQAVQMLSGIMKTLYDTAKAVINNLRG